MFHTAQFSMQARSDGAMVPMTSRKGTLVLQWITKVLCSVNVVKFVPSVLATSSVHPEPEARALVPVGTGADGLEDVVADVDDVDVAEGVELHVLVPFWACVSLDTMLLASASSVMVIDCRVFALFLSETMTPATAIKATATVRAIRAIRTATLMDVTPQKLRFLGDALMASGLCTKFVSHSRAGW